MFGRAKINTGLGSEAFFSSGQSWSFCRRRRRRRRHRRRRCCDVEEMSKNFTQSLTYKVQVLPEWHSIKDSPAMQMATV